MKIEISRDNAESLLKLLDGISNVYVEQLGANACYACEEESVIGPVEHTDNCICTLAIQLLNDAIEKHKGVEE